VTFTIDSCEISAADCARDVMAITKMRFLGRAAPTRTCGMTDGIVRCTSMQRPRRAQDNYAAGWPRGSTRRPEARRVCCQPASTRSVSGVGARQRNGRAIFHLEFDVEATIGALIASERLSESEALQHELVEHALAAGSLLAGIKVVVFASTARNGLSPRR
jgi:hypothetical protein